MTWRACGHSPEIMYAKWWEKLTWTFDSCEFKIQWNITSYFWLKILTCHSFPLCIDNTSKFTKIYYNLLYINIWCTYMFLYVLFIPNFRSQELTFQTKLLKRKNFRTHENTMINFCVGIPYGEFRQPSFLFNNGQYHWKGEVDQVMN